MCAHLVAAKGFTIEEWLRTLDGSHHLWLPEFMYEEEMAGEEADYSKEVSRARCVCDRPFHARAREPLPTPRPSHAPTRARRIHVERFISQLKVFRLLKNVDMYLAPWYNHILQSACFLTLFMPPIVARQ